MSLRKAHVMELPGSDTKAIWIDKGLAAHDEQLYWCMQLHLTADETCSYEVRTRLDKSPSSKVVMVTTHPAHGLPTKLEQVMLRGLAQQYMLDRRLPGYHRNSEVLDIIRKLEDPPTESILIGSTWVGAHKIDATNFILALTWDGEGLTVMQRAFIEQGATTQLPASKRPIGQRRTPQQRLPLGSQLWPETGVLVLYQGHALPSGRATADRTVNRQKRKALFIGKTTPTLFVWCVDTCDWASWLS